MNNPFLQGALRIASRIEIIVDRCGPLSKVKVIIHTPEREVTDHCDCDADQLRRLILALQSLGQALRTQVDLYIREVKSLTHPNNEN